MCLAQEMYKINKNEKKKNIVQDDLQSLTSIKRKYIIRSEWILE